MDETSVTGHANRYGDFSRPRNGSGHNDNQKKVCLYGQGFSDTIEPCERKSNLEVVRSKKKGAWRYDRKANKVQNLTFGCA